MRQPLRRAAGKATNCKSAIRLAVIAKFFCVELATMLLVSFAHGENDAATKQVNKSGAPAKRKAEELQKRTQADALVREALFHEIYGETDQRDSILSDAAKLAPDFAPAMWHSGKVQIRGQWVTIDDAIKLAAANPLMATYIKRREKTPDTELGNERLAAWCAAHRLDDEARAHFERTLQFDPDNVTARANLGYRRSDGRWVLQTELARQMDDAKQLQQSLNQWLPRANGMLLGFLSNNAAAQDSAVRQWNEIKDLAAIPALERTFSLVNEELALLLVEKLAQWNDPRATEAIARQAVLSPSDAVRQAAAEKMRTRPKEEYVPQLLALMRSPIQLFVTMNRFGSGPNAQPIFREAMVREDQNSVDVGVRSTYYHMASQNGTNGNADNRNLQVLALDLRQNFALDTAAANRANFVTDAANKRTMDALSLATSQTALTTPDGWWDWWNEENEFEIQFAKSVGRINVERDVVVADENDYAPPTVESTDWHDPIPRTLPASCLVAGTTIWTNCGHKPVENIRTGDVVLSQSVDSGEVAFKPVLRTTIRPPVQVFSIESSGETLKATGGHLFWVAGQGWTKTRNLKSGQTLHCATGTVQVSDIVPVEKPEQTYNLVVADFNTYFVGPQKILAHDVTERKPTRSIVPGLPRE